MSNRYQYQISKGGVWVCGRGVESKIIALWGADSRELRERAFRPASPLGF